MTDAEVMATINQRDLAIIELEETATWLDQRAVILEGIGTAARATTRDQLLDESARYRGRAMVIRQTILKAKGVS